MTGGSLAARALIAAVRCYQLVLSPLFAGSCRYLPSCSEYMIGCVRRYGAMRGGWLGLRRLGRCHPLGAHGFDPVPDVWPPHAGGGMPAPGSRPGGPDGEVR